MKKIIIALLLFTGVAQAQFSVDNQWFVEGGLGMAVPLSVQSPSSGANGALSLIHVQANLRYMFNDYVGLQGGLQFDQFKNKDKESADLRLATLQVCYNLGEALAIPASTREKVGLLVHAGGGLGSFSSKFDDSDLVGALIVGVKPYLMINKKVSLFADLAYTATLQQGMYFNGVSARSINADQLTGSQLGITFGVNVAIDKW